MMGKNRIAPLPALPYKEAKENPLYWPHEENTLIEQPAEYPCDAERAEAPEEYCLEEPVAEGLIEEPAFEELMAKTQIGQSSCNEPVRATDISVDPSINDPIIEAGAAEANSCDEHQLSKDTGSFVFGLKRRKVPKGKKPNIANATPASTQDGGKEHWEKLFVCCAQCTRMVLITTGGTCPFRALGLGKSQNRCSIAMTSCRSCEKGNISAFVDYQAFRDQCARNFDQLRLSPKLMQGSHLHRVAETVAGDRVEIMQKSGGILYVDMGGLLEQMTDDCTMRGVRHDVSREGMSKEELVMPFLPGAFA
jgi:hypothetical protein